MPNIRQIAGPRFFAEAAAIVVSILVAFWIDAWWEERAQRAAELEYLVALREDVAATQEMIGERIIYVGERFSSVNQVLEAVSAIDAQSVPDSISKMLGDVYGVRGFTPVIATYQDMVNSGNLRIIRDKRLRLAMAELIELLKDVDYHTFLISEIYWKQHAPFVNRNFVVSEFGWFLGETGGVFSERARIFGATPESPFNVNSEALRTKEFWNLMFDWKVLYADQLEPLLKSRNRCDEVLNLLSIQIEKAGS